MSKCPKLLLMCWMEPCTAATAINVWHQWLKENQRWFSLFLVQCCSFTELLLPGGLHLPDHLPLFLHQGFLVSLHRSLQHVHVSLQTWRTWGVTRVLHTSKSWQHSVFWYIQSWCVCVCCILSIWPCSVSLSLSSSPLERVHSSLTLATSSLCECFRLSIWKNRKNKKK